MLASNLLGAEVGPTWGAAPRLSAGSARSAFPAMAWTAVRGLGFSEATLRLVLVADTLASASPLFVPLARRVLGPASIGTLLAVGLFAVAQPPIRFAGEFKPYSTDLLAATVLLLLAVAWLREPGRSRWLWALAAVAPVGVAVSLPSLFVIVAVAVVGPGRGSQVAVGMGRRGPGLRRSQAGRRPGRGVSADGRCGQYQGEIARDRAYFLEFWSAGLLSVGGALDRPGELSWLVRARPQALLRTQVPPRPDAPAEQGARRWSSPGCRGGLPFQPPGTAGVVVLLLLPFVFAFAASVLRRYPYGMSPRVAQFLVPSTLILTAAGFDAVIARVRPGVCE